VSSEAVSLDRLGVRVRVWARAESAERALFVVFAVASFAVFFLHAVHAAVDNRVFIGADGTVARDQLQYLAWATDAGNHGLIANLYAFHLGSHVFLHPIWLLSGLAHVQLGLSYSLLVAVWKAATLVGLFVAVRAYARSLLGPDRGSIVIAILLALFMCSPLYVLVNMLKIGGSRIVNLETLSVSWIAGYWEIALAVAAMIVFLLEVDALLSEPDGRGVGRRRRTLIACAAGLAAAWLHPWQGATLLVILAALVAWERPSWRRHRRLLPLVLATAAPLVYYFVLPRVDAGWTQAQHFTAGIWNLAGDKAIVIALLPVALFALPGYAGRAETVRERLLRLWPIAGAVVFLAVRQDPFHALGGLSVPAALLIVRGWPWIRQQLAHGRPGRARWLAGAGVAVAVAGALIVIGRRATTFTTGSQSVAEIQRDDARALDRIAASSLAGGVLTRGYLGSWVPVVTDHATWTGHSTWTPSYYERNDRVSALFDGSFDGTPERERSFVQSTGARFVLEPCGSRARLDAALLPAGFGAARIGCATLYTRT
jgi:hypothetical protein